MPNYLRINGSKIKRLQRRVSRRQKNSNNRRKAVKLLVRQHEEVSNQRQDFLHKTSRQLVSETKRSKLKVLLTGT